ncbi:MAG: hypothetical protein Q8O19_03415 [Rectinemataceae bacterium]|nr:hypothetical protein [Rectinemataceae bacterium]
MKRYYLPILLIAGVIATSCVPALNSMSPGSDSAALVEFSLELPPVSKGIKTVTFTTGDKAWVKAFDSSKNSLDIGGGTADRKVTLTWSDTNNRWEGFMDLSGVSGDITLLAVVENSSGQVVYKGSDPFNIIDITRNTAKNLTAAAGFTFGDIGPGGGYVYGINNYNATTAPTGSYSNGWRYLEASPVDLSLDWTEAEYVDTSTHVVTNGDVYLIGSPATPVLTKYHFYWGPGGDTTTNPDYTLLTTALIGDGQVNTFTRLDAGSSATPKLKKANGRKAVPLNTSTNTRRDTPDTLKTWTKNGFTDWFIPSKDELDAMYTRIGSSGVFSSAYYWSSTEDLTADYWTDELINSVTVQVPNAYAKNFGTGAGMDMQRDTPSRVRPTRRF